MHKMMWVFVCLCCLPALAWADNTLAYLDNPMGARAVGMGSAFVAVADDPTAVFWNPAGLATQHFSRLKFSYQNDIFNYTNIYMCAGISSPMGKFGLGFTSNQNGMLLQVPTPNNERERPSSTGSLSDLAMTTYLAYGSTLRQGLMVGATAKVLYRQLASASALGAALDGGILFHFVRGWSLGLQGKNLLATGMQWSGTSNNPKDAVSSSIELGLAGHLGDHLIALAYNLNGTGACGAEYKLNPSLWVRGGLQWPLGQAARYSLGTSLDNGDFSLDYSLRIDTDANLTDSLEHTLSIGFKI